MDDLAAATLMTHADGMGPNDCEGGPRDQAAKSGISD